MTQTKRMADMTREELIETLTELQFQMHGDQNVIIDLVAENKRLRSVLKEAIEQRDALDDCLDQLQIEQRQMHDNQETIERLNVERKRLNRELEVAIKQRDILADSVDLDHLITQLDRRCERVG